MLKSIICNVVALSTSIVVVAQNSDWNTSWNFNVGCTYIWHDNFKGTRFPGFRIFCGFAANAVYQKHLVLNYGPSLSFYTKSIGANLNPLVPDLQLDFTNTGSVGYCWGPQLAYYKLYRTLDNGAYYNSILNVENAILFSSNFIVNSHKRNQVNGALTASINNVTVNYYNDGGAPFTWLPLADNFDRYWTGGLNIFVHTNSDYNAFEIGFNQFTGYKTLLFEACDQLGINVPNYNSARGSEADGDGLSHNNYNTSAYYATVHLNRYISANVGWEGALKMVNHKTLRTTYFGLQEMIHTILNYPLHPNLDDGKLFFGANFNTYVNEKL